MVCAALVYTRPPRVDRGDNTAHIGKGVGNSVRNIGDETRAHRLPVLIIDGIGQPLNHAYRVKGQFGQRKACKQLADVVAHVGKDGP